MTWTWKKAEIGTYVDFDKMVAEYTTKVTGEDLYNLLGKTAIDDNTLFVYVDGEALDEPYTEGKPTEHLAMQSANAGSIEYPYTVPEGCVWVMGDNRTNSLDSRYFGPIEVSSITSHGLFIFWPLSDAGSL